tara:strand:+ start:7454 stop:7654 length:201 start_codon:yes stop_codon:yes gene_type:complete
MFKKTLDIICDHCGADYQLAHDEEEILETPGFCPFCGTKLAYIKEAGEGIEDDTEWHEEETSEFPG